MHLVYNGPAENYIFSSCSIASTVLRCWRKVGFELALPLLHHCVVTLKKSGGFNPLFVLWSRNWCGRGNIILVWSCQHYSRLWIIQPLSYNRVGCVVLVVIRMHMNHTVRSSSAPAPCIQLLSPSSVDTRNKATCSKTTGIISKSIVNGVTRKQIHEKYHKQTSSLWVMGSGGLQIPMHAHFCKRGL